MGECGNDVAECETDGGRCGNDVGECGNDVGECGNDVMVARRMKRRRGDGVVCRAEGRG